MPVNLKSTLKDMVRCCLAAKPETRDNENLLISKIWQKECRDKKIFSLPSFFEELEKGTFTHTETIRRVRQKLQEENPELRGDLYLKRKNRQKDIQSQLFEG
ncbi:MAG: hypothetical protein DRH26_01370 [Deltaproteobacteria bacterium]|nr:MAG: hypothetical protein DRH26_01370 [Deltaproteobacteria bacterium]